MTNEKFTPGPWSICFPNDNPGIDGANGEYSIIIYGEPGDPKDQCGIQGRTKEEQHANARLIAAAPDLLEAAKDAENEIENAIVGLTTNPLAYAEAIKQRLERTLETCRAAIAKAEGRE
jgi:hypothetical protein